MVSSNIGNIVMLCNSLIRLYYTVLMEIGDMYICMIVLELDWYMRYRIRYEYSYPYTIYHSTLYAALSWAWPESARMQLQWLTVAPGARMRPSRLRWLW